MDDGVWQHVLESIPLLRSLKVIGYVSSGLVDAFSELERLDMHRFLFSFRSVVMGDWDNGYVMTRLTALSCWSTKYV